MKVCKQQAAAAAAQLESSLASSKQEQQQHSWLMKWMKQFKTNIYDYFDLKKKVPAVVKINHQQHARDEPISEHTQLYNRHTTYININSTANKHPNCCWDLLRSSQALAFNSNVASKNDFFSLSHIWWCVDVVVGDGVLVLVLGFSVVSRARYLETVRCDYRRALE